jgi:hypothetical protein
MMDGRVRKWFVSAFATALSNVPLVAVSVEDVTIYLCSLTDVTLMIVTIENVSRRCRIFFQHNGAFPPLSYHVVAWMSITKFVGWSFVVIVVQYLGCWDFQTLHSLISFMESNERDDIQDKNTHKRGCPILDFGCCFLHTRDTSKGCRTVFNCRVSCLCNIIICIHWKSVCI